MSAKRFFLAVDVNNELGTISDEKEFAGLYGPFFHGEAAKLKRRAMRKNLSGWMLWKTVGVVWIPQG